MAEEIKKPDAAQQAPAQGTPGEEKPKVEEPKPTPAGLDAYTKEDLQKLYKNSPQLFAGIVEEKVKEPEKKEPGKKEEPKPETPKSAAPMVYGDKEIKLPDDVPVNREAVAAYLSHAKENGLSAEQVQKQIDWQTKVAREESAKEAERVRAREAARPTPQQEDAANIEKLKADKVFGGQNYEANMEIARQAAKKFGDPELLERLKTSDPVLIKHFWTLGKLDAEDTTLRAPNRTGNETDDALKAEAEHQRARFPNSPQMFTTPQ
jgi:hypothetical protein